MISLWIAIAVLTLIAIVCVAAPYIAAAKDDSPSQSQLNKKLYQQRLGEIENDDSQGLIDNKSALQQELQHNLLEDIPETEIKRNSSQTWLMLAPALALVLFGSLFLYKQIGFAPDVAYQLKVIERLPELSMKVMNNDVEVSAQEVEEFSIGLRSKLAEQPDDARGWFIMAKLAQANQDLGMMTDAAEKAYAIDPSNPSVVMVYAQALMATEDPSAGIQAEHMLVKLLSSQPENLDAWSLYAFIAFEQEQYPLAIERWKKMMDYVDADSERYTMIQRSIDFANEQIEANGGDALADTAQQSIDLENLAEGEYAISIDLAQGVELPSNAYLFVFAKAVNGPPMPLAARKLPFPSFPLQVRLSDEHSMLEGLKLSSLPEFKVIARLSYDDNVQTTDGDWQGEQIVSKGFAELITIKIDKQL
ncbi:c-type cytochrome biogenesis protein CcmI [Alginatibacterium sediminis]|uniref:C-type cytochrome biogenesis protein CcmI n=1 Tax=Alginatibacterium sediminis TaxID=2164068 RepID=A0A420EFN3_9ALTE|nr:c-type cytochrome biogenesis protein CcmI [Alginatibacterium sediminis]RKF19512.1 c-type cytochrome biogenesis protein CcmI [Alginatibacterium sediminis]